jgi:hypothetical protein
MAADWERLSNGAVEVKIFAGSIAGNEQDMIRKIRLGALQGGVFSNMGLAKIDHSLTVLSIPFLFHSREEFNAVFDKIKPSLEKTIEDKGFKVMLWTLAGWVNFFTKGQVVDPEDLKKYKVSVTPDFPELEQIWKRMGYEIITGEANELLIHQERRGVWLIPAAFWPRQPVLRLVPLCSPVRPARRRLLLSDKACVHPRRPARAVPRSRRRGPAHEETTPRGRC